VEARLQFITQHYSCERLHKLAHGRAAAACSTAFLQWLTACGFKAKYDRARAHVSVKRVVTLHLTAALLDTRIFFARLHRWESQLHRSLSRRRSACCISWRAAAVGSLNALWVGFHCLYRHQKECDGMMHLDVLEGQLGRLAGGVRVRLLATMWLRFVKEGMAAAFARLLQWVQRCEASQKLWRSQAETLQADDLWRMRREADTERASHQVGLLSLFIVSVLLDETNTSTTTYDNYYYYYYYFCCCLLLLLLLLTTTTITAGTASEANAEPVRRAGEAPRAAVPADRPALRRRGCNAGRALQMPCGRGESMEGCVVGPALTSCGAEERG
jgi:hypothetical protein